MPSIIGDDPRIEQCHPSGLRLRVHHGDAAFDGIQLLFGMRVPVRVHRAAGMTVQVRMTVVRVAALIVPPQVKPSGVGDAQAEPEQGQRSCKIDFAPISCGPRSADRPKYRAESERRGDVCQKPAVAAVRAACIID
jgi:hypothetical protein